MEYKSLSQVLREHLDLRGVSRAQFAEQIGISARHLEALLDGEFKKLPALPYVRGYLAKIAHALGLKGEDLWALYRREADVRSSGPDDRLPENRYAIKTMDRRWFVAGAVLLLVVLYAGVNAPRLLGTPEIAIANPARETEIVSVGEIMLQGTIDPRDKLLIDGREVLTDPAGAFSERYLLEPGLNRITFTVQRILGREVTETRQVIYQP